MVPVVVLLQFLMQRLAYGYLLVMDSAFQRPELLVPLNRAPFVQLLPRHMLKHESQIWEESFGVSLCYSCCNSEQARFFRCLSCLCFCMLPFFVCFVPCDISAYSITFFPPTLQLSLNGPACQGLQMELHHKLFVQTLARFVKGSNRIELL